MKLDSWESGTVLFSSSLVADTRCKRNVQNKGIDRHGAVIYWDVLCGGTVDTCHERLSEMRFVPRFVVAKPAQSW